MKCILVLSLYWLIQLPLFALPYMPDMLQMKGIIGSKELVSRYNILRNKKSLPPVKSDSLLDMVALEILVHDQEFNCRTCKYSEEEVRKIFYERGIIDYQYEIIEFLNADTASAYEGAFLKDSFSQIRCGYARNKGWNIILKTNAYLEYIDALVSMHGQAHNEMDESSPALLQVETDSITYFLKPLIRQNYRFQYASSVPIGSTHIMEKEPTFPIENISGSDIPEKRNVLLDDQLMVRSKHPEMYVIIINETDDIIGILK